MDKGFLALACVLFAFLIFLLIVGLVNPGEIRTWSEVIKDIEKEVDR